VRGAYQGFFDSNIQPDFVHVEHINEYPVVYLPYPVMLKQETARKLIAYVRKGGRLICEGLPGYFGDRGHVGEVQPNLGLDRLFGAHEKYVEFTPDLLENLTLEVRGSKINGRYFLQEYSTVGGRIVGTFDNGAAAAVENHFGKGKALLIGTFPSAGYYRHHSPGTMEFFAGLLDWGGVAQRVHSSDPTIKARLHEGSGGKYLWVLNPTRETREVTVRFSDRDTGLRTGKDLWQGRPVTVNGNTVKVTVAGRDAVVIRLQ
jgi:beta-galactosidase